jgi:hypothetical protein
MAKPRLTLGVTADKNRTEILSGDWPTIRENADRLFGNGGEAEPAPTPGTRGPMSEAHKQKLRDAAHKRKTAAKGKTAASAKA